MLIAKKQNKPLMVFLIKKDSVISKKMFTTTFLNQDYIKKINDKYISIIAIYEGKSSYPIEMFYTLTFPVIFFVSQKDESFLIDPIFGYISPKKFNSFLPSIF